MAKSAERKKRREICTDICKYGFFTDVLPPCFNSDSFADSWWELKGDAGCLNATSPTKLSFYKNHSERRVLAIANPCSFEATVSWLYDRWSEIEKFAKSDHSLSPITYMGNYCDKPGESINNENSRDARKVASDFISNLKKCVALSLGYRYQLQVDVSSFYDSIYTHSITWAICGKEEAKKYTVFDPSAQMPEGYDIANKFDELIRKQNCQETNGILTGPFTSRIFSEIIMAAIDKELARQKTFMGAKFVFKRYVDDYKFYFRTEEEARASLWTIQKVLEEFNLSLNHSKTKIQEFPFDSVAPQDLKQTGMAVGKIGKASNVTVEELLNEAKYSFERGFAGAFRYALKALPEKLQPSDDAEVVLATLFNISVLKPKYAKYIITFLRSNKEALEGNRDHGESKLERAVSSELDRSLQLGLDHEMLNALYYARELKLRLPEELVAKALDADNDLAALIALDLAKNHRDRIVSCGVAHEALDTQTLDATIDRKADFLRRQSMDGPHWLLVYECYRHQLVDGIAIDKGETASFFHRMDTLGVSFYEEAE